MNGKIVFTVAKATFREFWRTPEAVFWTFGFPVLMAVVLGFSFQPGKPKPVPIAVVAAVATEAEPLLAALRASDRLQVELLAPAAADAALARGRVALLVHGPVAAPVLRLDPTRAEAELAQLLVERALHGSREGPVQPGITAETEDRPGSRYIDFLIPGLIGLNLLGAGMWGVGFNLVQMRTQNLLRRLMVTPMQRSEFLLGYLLGRFALVIPEAGAILAFGTLLWEVPFRGSALGLFLLVAVGGLMFSGLGCLVASRARTIEGVAGLMNLVQLPMWLLGGSFFNNDHLEGVVHWVAEALPLTHLNRALRDCMLEPVAVTHVALPLGVLAAVGVLAFAIALKIFRWR